MMNDDLTLLLKSHKHRPLGRPRARLAGEGIITYTNFCVDCSLVYWTRTPPSKEEISLYETHL